MSDNSIPVGQSAVAQATVTYTGSGTPSTPSGYNWVISDNTIATIEGDSTGPAITATGVAQGTATLHIDVVIDGQTFGADAIVTVTPGTGGGGGGDYTVGIDWLPSGSTVPSKAKLARAPVGTSSNYSNRK